MREYKNKDVNEYIIKSPKWAKKTLKELRRTIRSAAPKAKESISYRIPYYSLNGRVAYFAFYKKHCSFFWISSKDKKKFARELKSLRVVGNTLRILEGEKVPQTLIKKIVKHHTKLNEENKKYEKG